MTKKWIIVLFILGLLSACQDPEPVQVTKTVFAHDYELDLEKHFFSEHPHVLTGAYIDPKIKREFKLLRPLLEKDRTAVVNVTLKRLLGVEIDLYVHLLKYKDDLWKINSIIPSLYGYNTDSIDSLIHEKRKHIFLNRPHERLKYMYDNELVDYFKEHQKDFEQLAETYTQKRLSLRLKDLDKDKTLKEQMQNLLIQKIEKDGFYENEYSLQFIIDEYFNSSRGYLYIPHAWLLPEMSSSDYIMIRYINDNWFLYKRR